MMSDFKPIETIYNGYRFRSRLEARWAVFYDMAGIPFEYEPEGFCLNDGTYYLPDFYLPWFKCYVEIKHKGLPYAQLQEAKNKLRRLFDMSENKITMLCVGDPADWDVTVFCNDANDSGGGSSEWPADFVESPKHYNELGFDEWGFTKHWVALCISVHGSDRNLYTANWRTFDYVRSDEVSDYRNDFNFLKIKARQARFEHGETPNKGGF